MPVVPVNGNAMGRWTKVLYRPVDRQGATLDELQATPAFDAVDCVETVPRRYDTVILAGEPWTVVDVEWDLSQQPGVPVIVTLIVRQR